MLAQRLGVPVVMHRESPARLVDLRVDDGEMVVVGNLRLQCLYTPGHTRGHLCLLRMADRAGDERAGSCTAVGSPELERAAAPLVDLLAVDLLLPTDGGVEGGLGIQLLELRLVG